MQQLKDVPNYGRVFPLYVPPIDWYFLVDDRPECPMSFFLEFEFSGSLDQDKFQDALHEAIKRHPLLFCIVQPGKKDRLSWVLAPDRLNPIDWSSDTGPIEPEGGVYLDIRTTTGLRIWVREAADSVRVVMQFHHAACDGTGAYRFVGDLLGCYMKRLPSCEGKVELGDFDVAQLKVCRAKMRTIRMNDSTWKKFRIAFKEAWQFIGPKIAPLSAPGQQSSAASFPGIVTQSFSTDQLSSLRGIATSEGATLNDLFLRGVFQMALQWNQATSARRKIRVLVPADMRDGEDFEVPACNMTACTFVTRKTGEIRDAAKLMDLVRLDTLELKNGNPQSAFVNALTSGMEGNLMPWILGRGACLATCVYSNAGDPARRFTGRLPKKRGKVSCDEFTLESITGVPPMRPNTRSTLSSSTYGRDLTFSMRCDPQLFGEDDTRKMLGMFCDQLKSLI